VLGGLALLLLLVVGAVFLGSSSKPDPVAVPTTSEPPTTAADPSTERSTRTTTAGSGPTTSVAGTGPASSVTASQAVAFLKEEQEKALPDVPVDDVSCPPEPYNVGHVIVCRLVLQGSPVLYPVEITAVDLFQVKQTKPIIDTDKAEKLVQDREPGTTADCGSPRIRQVDVGATFSCETESSTWDFTVSDEDGQVAGTRR